MEQRVIDRLKAKLAKAQSEEEVLKEICSRFEDENFLGVCLLYMEAPGKIQLIKHSCCCAEPEICERLHAEEAMEQMHWKIISENRPVSFKITDASFPITLHGYPLLTRGKRCFGSLFIACRGDSKPKHAKTLVKLLGEIFSVIIIRKRIISNPSIVADILNLVDEAIWVIDENDIILDANPAAEAMFGVPLVDLIGKSCQEVAAEYEYFPNVCALTRKAAATGRASAIESKAGLIYSLNVYRMKTEGAGTIYIYIAREISKHVRYHMQLIQADRAKNMERITAGLAHEINNPLTAIIGFAGILLDMEKDKTKKALLKKIHQEANRCASIIKGLYALAPNAFPDYTITDINQVITGITELKLSFYKMHSIKLQLELDPDIPSIYTIPSAVYEAVNNIVNNAEDAVLKRERDRLIRIRTSSDGEYINIDIENNGPSIPPEIMEKIFEPFFSTKPKGEGTGVGLSLAKEAIEQIGGRIIVENLEPTGVRFTIQIPAHTPRSERMMKRLQLTGERILIVSQEPVVSEMLAMLLERSGAETAIAKDKEEIFKLLEKQGPFSRIIINETTEDIPLPKLVSEIMELYPYFRNRCIALVSVPLKADERIAIRSSGCKILLKPFSESELLRELLEEEE